MPNNQIITAGNNSSTDDPLFSQVILLLNNEGANGSGAWTDKSPKARSITKVGNPTVNGDNGLVLTPGNYLQLPASPDWLFPGDFCMEFWLTSAMTGVQDILNGGPMSDGTHWTVLTNGSQMQFYPRGAGNFDDITAPPNVRHHIAAYRLGTGFYLAVDGKHPGTLNLTGDMGNTTIPLTIGQRSNGTGPTTAVLGPIRITAGNGRYPGTNFVPPEFAAFPTK